MSKKLLLHDTIINELVEIDTPEDAVRYVKDMYTEDGTIHPDFHSFDILTVVSSVSAEIDENDTCTGISLKPKDNE